MTTTNITNFRKNAFQYVEQTVKYNEPLNICTKDGNAVLLSEEDYSGIMETLYLVSVPGMREKLLAAKAEPLEDCVDINILIDIFSIQQKGTFNTTSLHQIIHPINGF